MADPGRRFDDLFNFVQDPATPQVAFVRVVGKQGADTPGIDGLSATDIEDRIGVPGFLDELRARLRQGTFRPLPVQADAGRLTAHRSSGRCRRLDRSPASIGASLSTWRATDTPS
ncbi:hypothetical protein [Streptomyces sp. NBC_00280]|uniref:hypothetical protein n=1 Tax=Streptomyces sp. NBC_00280 TaxID=2975699 RepID=UPI003253FABB